MGEGFLFSQHTTISILIATFTILIIPSSQRSPLKTTMRSGCIHSSCLTTIRPPKCDPCLHRKRQASPNETKCSANTQITDRETLFRPMVFVLRSCCGSSLRVYSGVVLVSSAILEQAVLKGLCPISLISSALTDCTASNKFLQMFGQKTTVAPQSSMKWTKTSPNPQEIVGIALLAGNIPKALGRSLDLSEMNCPDHPLEKLQELHSRIAKLSRTLHELHLKTAKILRKVPRLHSPSAQFPRQLGLEMQGHYRQPLPRNILMVTDLTDKHFWGFNVAMGDRSTTQKHSQTVNLVSRLAATVPSTQQESARGHASNCLQAISLLRRKRKQLATTTRPCQPKHQCSDSCKALTTHLSSPAHFACQPVI